jgi:hypothetical protein
VKETFKKPAKILMSVAKGEKKRMHTPGNAKWTHREFFSGTDSAMAGFAASSPAKVVSDEFLYFPRPAPVSPSDQGSLLRHMHPPSTPMGLYVVESMPDVRLPKFRHILGITHKFSLAGHHKGICSQERREKCVLELIAFGWFSQYCSCWPDVDQVKGAPLPIITQEVAPPHA